MKIFPIKAGWLALNHQYYATETKPNFTFGSRSSSSTTTQQPQHNGGFGGFGSSQQQQQPQHNGGFGGFGSSQQQQKQPQHNGGFGAFSSSQQQQQPQSSVFGGFGSHAQQQQKQSVGSFSFGAAFSFSPAVVDQEDISPAVVDQEDIITLIYQDGSGNQTDGFTSLGNRWYDPTQHQKQDTSKTQQDPIPTNKACIITIRGKWYHHLASNHLDEKPYNHHDLFISHSISHVHDEGDVSAKIAAFKHLISHSQQSIQHPDYDKWKRYTISTAIQQKFAHEAEAVCEIGVLTTNKTGNTISSFVFTPLRQLRNYNNRLQFDTPISTSATHNNDRFGGVLSSTLSIAAAILSPTRTLLFYFPLSPNAPKKINIPTTTTTKKQQSTAFNSPLDEAEIITKWWSLNTKISLFQPTLESFKKVQVCLQHSANCNMLSVDNVHPWYSTQLNYLQQEISELLNNKILFPNLSSFIETLYAPIDNILSKTWGLWHTKEEQLNDYQTLKHYTQQLSTILKSQHQIDEMLLFDYLGELPDNINTRITSLATQHDIQHYKTLYSQYGYQKPHVAKPTQDCIDLILINHHSLLDTITTMNDSAPVSAFQGLSNNSNDNISTLHNNVEKHIHYKHYSDLTKQNVEMVEKQKEGLLDIYERDIAIYKRKIGQLNHQHQYEIVELKEQHQKLLHSAQHVQQDAIDKVENIQQQCQEQMQQLETQHQKELLKQQMYVTMVNAEIVELKSKLTKLSTPSAATTTTILEKNAKDAQDLSDMCDKNNNNKEEYDDQSPFFIKKQFLLLQEQLSKKDKQIEELRQDYSSQLHVKDQQHKDLLIMHQEQISKKDEALAAKDQQIMQLMQMLLQQQQIKQ